MRWEPRSDQLFEPAFQGAVAATLEALCRGSGCVYATIIFSQLWPASASAAFSFIGFQISGLCTIAVALWPSPSLRVKCGAGGGPGTEWRFRSLLRDRPPILCRQLVAANHVLSAKIYSIGHAETRDD